MKILILRIFNLNALTHVICLTSISYFFRISISSAYRINYFKLWFTFQGGPGASSTGYGNFEVGIGPLDLNLEPRNTTWVCFWFDLKMHYHKHVMKCTHIFISILACE